MRVVGAPFPTKIIQKSGLTCNHNELLINKKIRIKYIHNMKKYIKPFVKESEIETDEILAGSEYQGEVINNEPIEGEETTGGIPAKQINVWE